MIFSKAYRANRQRKRRFRRGFFENKTTRYNPSVDPSINHRVAKTMIEKFSIQIVFPAIPKSIFYVYLEPGHVGYVLDPAQMAAVCVYNIGSCDCHCVYGTNVFGVKYELYT